MGRNNPHHCIRSSALSSHRVTLCPFAPVWHHRPIGLPQSKFLNIFAHMSNYDTETGVWRISMPGLNGTEPQGNVPTCGREFGRCRMVPVPAHEPATATQPDQYQNGAAISQGSVQIIPVYSRVRGGVPCGCGRGFGFRGDRRLQE